MIGSFIYNIKYVHCCETIKNRNNGDIYIYYKKSGMNHMFLYNIV